jgi:hypothetical protein
LVETLRDPERLADLRHNGGGSFAGSAQVDRNLFDAEPKSRQALCDELLSVLQVYKALGGG